METPTSKPATEEATPDEKIDFKCKGCKMSESVDYFGKLPPFTKNIEFLEESFVMRDPFSAPPSKHGTRSFTEYFIVLGTRCVLCQSSVCKDCSLFYKSTFCYPCAESRIKEFPLEMQSKIRKELIAIKTSRENYENLFYSSEWSKLNSCRRPSDGQDVSTFRGLLVLWLESDERWELVSYA